MSWIDELKRISLAQIIEAEGVNIAEAERKIDDLIKRLNDNIPTGQAKDFVTIHETAIVKYVREQLPANLAGLIPTVASAAIQTYKDRGGVVIHSASEFA